MWLLCGNVVYLVWPWCPRLRSDSMRWTYAIAAGKRCRCGTRALLHRGNDKNKWMTSCHCQICDGMPKEWRAIHERTQLGITPDNSGTINAIILLQCDVSCFYFDVWLRLKTSIWTLSLTFYHLRQDLKFGNSPENTENPQTLVTEIKDVNSATQHLFILNSFKLLCFSSEVDFHFHICMPLKLQIKLCSWCNTTCIINQYMWYITVHTLLGFSLQSYK